MVDVQPVRDEGEELLSLDIYNRVWPQIVWAKSASYERLITQNELRNEPMRRLNERLGYGLAPGRVIVRGSVAAS